MQMCWVMNWDLPEMLRHWVPVRRALQLLTAASSAVQLSAGLGSKLALPSSSVWRRLLVSCPGVHTSFVFGLELFKKTSSFRLEFHVGGVLILYIGGFAAFADEGVHV